jgi:hypothetical protein
MYKAAASRNATGIQKINKVRLGYAVTFEFKMIIIEF